MSDTGEALRRPAARQGRCSEHPAEVAVAECAACQRPLCLACAIPVRGTVVGAECLGTLVEDLPPQAPPSPAGRRLADLVAAVGFLIVVAASIFPWSKSAVGTSGFGGAWSPHWSLLAVLAGCVGLVAAIVVRRGRVPPLPAGAIYAACAILVVVGTILHVARPPTLSTVAGSLPWRFALLGAGVALAGALWTLGRIRRR